MPASPTGRKLSARIAHLAVKQPRRVLLLALAIALAAAPAVLHLRFNTDIVSLLPRHAPGAAAFSRFTRAFSEEQILFILVEGSDQARLTDFVGRYAQALRALPEIAEVRERLGAGAAGFVRDHLLALLDENDLHELAAKTTPAALRLQAQRLRMLLTAPGGSALAPLLTADPLELTKLLGKRLQAGFSGAGAVDTQSGYFRSADGQALLIFVRPRQGPFNLAADRRLLAQVLNIAEHLGGRASNGKFAQLTEQPAVSFTGPYAYAPEYASWLEHDLQISTLVSGAAVLLLFALLLGALRVLPWVALPLALGLWLTAALAWLFYGHISAISLAFATILLAIGIDLPIQIYNRLREELTRNAPPEAIYKTIERLAGPSLLATLGPAAVFFACSLSEYQGLKELGILAGMGLLINLAAMLLVLPALLAILPAKWWLPAERPLHEGAWFAWLGERAARRPRWVLGGLAILALGAIPLGRHVQYQRHLLAVEPPTMQASQVTREIEQRMGGRRQPLVILVEDTDPDKALSKSGAWRREAERLKQAGLLSSYESISSLFPSREEQNRRRTLLAGLNPPHLAGDLADALAQAGFKLEPFQGFLKQLGPTAAPIQLGDGGRELSFLVAGHVHDDAQGRLVSTFLYPAPGKQAAAMQTLGELTRTSLGGTLTGIPVLEESLLGVIKRDTVRLSVAAVLLIVLLLAVYYRRPRPILAVLLPLSLAWILFAAALAWLKLPIDLFNLIIIPLVIGYGIDDHIFLLARYQEAPELGPARALASTGRAIVVTSLSTIAGFAGLALARFDGLRLLGLSGALAVGLCLLAALTAMPALLALLWPKRQG